MVERERAKKRESERERERERETEREREALNSPFIAGLSMGRAYYGCICLIAVKAWATAPHSISCHVLQRNWSPDHWLEGRRSQPSVVSR